MKGYKAYKKGMICKDFQYEVDKEYTHDGELILCCSGFHFCENPLDILNYYDLCDSEFSEVEATGKVTEARKEDTKRATDKIKIGRKLDLPAFIKASFEYLWELCSKEEGLEGDHSKHASAGDYSKHASAGDYSQHASAGDYSKHASSGHCSQHVSAGDYSQHASSGTFSRIASSGDYSLHVSLGDYSKHASAGHNSRHASAGECSRHASSGDCSKIALEGEDSVGACIGDQGKIKGKKGCWITLAEWKRNESKKRHVPVCVKSAQIDGIKLKEDTWYRLENGEFVECE